MLHCLYVLRTPNIRVLLFFLYFIVYILLNFFTIYACPPSQYLPHIYCLYISLLMHNARQIPSFTPPHVAAPIGSGSTTLYVVVYYWGVDMSLR